MPPLRQPCRSSRRLTSTVRAVYCAREEGHDGPCVFADGNGAHAWLDGYEWSNLRELLKAITTAPAGNPLTRLHTGDWTCQVLEKLRPYYLPHNQPNRTADDLIAEC